MVVADNRLLPKAPFGGACKLVAGSSAINAGRNV
jgi:hypothetical protein